MYRVQTPVLAELESCVVPYHKLSICSKGGSDSKARLDYL